MDNLLNSKNMPLSWPKVFIGFSMLAAIFWVIFGKELFAQMYSHLIANIYNPLLYVWLFVIYIIYRIVNYSEWKELKDWADYYGIEITYVKSYKLSEGKFKLSRLYRQEFKVGLKNSYGEEGEIYIYFIYKQLFNPFKKWLTTPIKSPKHGNIPNELP